MFKNFWPSLGLILCLSASYALYAGQNTEVDRATRDYLTPESMQYPQQDDMDAIAEEYCDPEDPDSEGCDIIEIEEEPDDESQESNP